MPLGDTVHDALARIGVTPERVERWLGRSCGGCEDRRQKLNAIGRWAARVVGGKVEKARDYLEEMLRWK